MVTENLLFFHLKDELGEPIFNAQRPAYYSEILKNKSLLYWSTMFPKIVKGICITQDCGIPIKHPQTGVICTSAMYKVPKFNSNDEYINYEQVYYPGNLTLNQASSNVPAMNSLLQSISGSLPNANYYGIERYSFGFTPPDMITIDPIPMKHLDFTINMQRFVRLTEIPMYYFEDFKNLFITDVQISLFNKYKHLSKGGNATYQGVEITTELLADLESGKDARKELVEKFEKNYWKDPSRFASMLHYDAP